MKRRLLYLAFLLAGVGIGLLGAKLGRTLDRTPLLGLFGALTIAFLIGHGQRRLWRGVPAARLPAVTVASLVSLVVTAIALIAYVAGFLIRGGGR